MFLASFRVSYDLLIPILAGGSVAAIITAIIGPYLATREGRRETYRKWQVDVAGEFLHTLEVVRSQLVDGPNLSPTDETVKRIDKLDVLRQRIDLIFMQRKNTPYAAGLVVNQARAVRQVGDLSGVDSAREQFIRCASDEIRSRAWWQRQDVRRPR
jgi:hypothetical protein